MKNFNTIGVHWEIKFLRGISQKTVIYRGELSKEGGLGQYGDLRGTFQKRGGGVFDRGIDTPMHTMRHNRKLGK